jgi:hypothetical protein
MSLPTRRLVPAAVAVLLALVVAGYFVTRPRPAGHTEGIAGRQALASFDSTPTAMSNACFTAYRVQTTGRYGPGHQVYALTFTLKNDPATVADLVSLLDRAECSKAVADATKSTRDRLGGDKSFAGLAVLYRTSSGARLEVP